MVYKIVSDKLYNNNNGWEISIMKYNINHQEFVLYDKDKNTDEITKRVFRTELVD